MTLGTILADLYRRLNYASSPASEVTTRLTAFVNEALQELLSDPGLGPYLDRWEPPLTVASVASQAVYAAPARMTRILGVSERTNDRKLYALDLDRYRALDPDPTANTGTPEAWVPLGAMAVAVQPSDASDILVDSTAAGDTNTAYLEGIRTGGYPTSLSVTMTGVTAVSFSATITDLIQITKFYLSAAAVGTVTLHEDASGGTELARIPIGQTFSRYQGFALWPTPASAITYYLDGDRDLPDMSITNDEPPLPARFHRLLVEGALIREWDKKHDTEQQVKAQQRWAKGVSALRYFLTCPPDYLPSTAARVERSRLGAGYPATEW